MNRPESIEEAGRRVRETESNLLRSGIKGILRCDSAEVVYGIARYVISQHRVLRLLATVIERFRRSPFPALVALVGALRSFLEPQRGGRSGGVVWVARLGNERRAIEPIIPLIPDLVWTELKFRWFPNTLGLAALARNLVPGARRTFRIARQLHRRYEFFRVLRVIELIAFYSRYLAIFRDGRFLLAVTSNHSNPHGIAFNIAARKSGLPVVLVTHGMPVRPVAKLTYDLALVHCQAALRTYLEEGCELKQALIHGRRQHFAPMPDHLASRLTFGIFLCKDVNDERLRALVEKLLSQPHVKAILVRPHPANLWRELDAWISSRNDPRLSGTGNGSVFEDLRASDIVLAGNSSVLVDAVTGGRPSGYVAGLDYGPPDLHRFVASGLIYSIDESTNLNPDALLRFYKRPEWPTVLRLFANVDEDQASIAASTAGTIRKLVASRELRQAGVS